MKVLIHDLPDGSQNVLTAGSRDDVKIISNDGTIKNCIGCFGCWIKTPGVCVIRDKYGDMGEVLSRCRELIIISQCFYGGFSPFVKNILDRSISYLHPYFRVINNEMHHRQRYDNHFDLSVWFYGQDITEAEKQTAEKLVQANAVNLDCSVQAVHFVRDITAVAAV